MVVVRCSCVLPGVNYGNFPRKASTSDQCFSGKSASFPLKVQKLISTFGDTLSRSFENHQALSGGKFILLELDDIKVFTSGQNHNHGQMQPCFNAMPRHLTSHQAMVLIRFPAMALIGSALMLATPLEALAETCEADKTVFDMPLLLFVAIVGATVGGLLARQRRAELKQLNEQLRQINTALRRQAKIESYAPSLSYAPVGDRIPENEVIVDPRKHELISRLKNGKNYLRNQDPGNAFAEFKSALEIAKNLKDPIGEKKAARGLGALLQRQGKYREAIKYHSMVLAISEREGKDSGNTEASGAIADCYTELGDLEQAGKYYDQYISRLQTD